MFFTDLATNNNFLAGMSLVGFLLIIPIIIALLQEGETKKTETRLLLITMSCQMLSCLANFICWIYEGNANCVTLLKLSSISTFIFTEGGLFVFMCYEIYMLKKRTYIADWVTYFVAFLCGTTIIIKLVGLSQPDPWFYGVDSGGNIFYTELYPLPHMIPLIVILFGAFLTWSCRKTVAYSELFALLSYFIFPLLGGIYDAIMYSTTVYPMGSLMALMLYSNIHTRIKQKEIINEKELTQSKAMLMVSQIQPHFMYNSLNAIYYLIGQDPERAQEAVSTFSDYLRQNVNSLRNDAPVRFSEEIGHTEAYLYLEKMRFEDMLEIESHIEADDFVVPALSIQPLVENAVKHGVTQRIEGGKVVISSKDMGKEYVVTIADDGVGFKPGEFKDTHAHSHVGIENVRSRLETMVGGKLIVKSVPGKGTTCTIIIPKESQPNG